MVEITLWLILLSKYDFCLVFKKQSDFPSLLWHMYVLLFSLKYYHKTYAFWHPSLKPLSFLIVKENYEGGHSHLPPTLECWKYFTMYQISPAGKKRDPVLSVYPWTFLASRKKFKYQQSLFLQTCCIQTFLFRNKATPSWSGLLVPVTLFKCNLLLRKYYPCNSTQSVNP